jgi:hypothetical protein
LFLVQSNYSVLRVLQSTNVGDSDGEPLDDELDAETMFSEKRPSTSRGPKSSESDVVFKVCISSLVLSSLVSLQNFIIRATLGHWPASCAAFYCSSSPKDLQ